MMSTAQRKWTRALLRQALEDEMLFGELRRSLADGSTEAEIRARVELLLAWPPHKAGKPYVCVYCDRPVDEMTGEVTVRAAPGRLDRARYRAVCRRCREEGNEPSDAG